MVLVIVGIVVVGPRKLPTLMRTAGQWIAKLKRMSTDLRAQSGIDDLIRNEGLEREIHELRSLSKMNVVETLMSPGIAAASAAPMLAGGTPAPPPRPVDFRRSEPLREREYPLAGCDSYDALADDAVPYPPPDHRAPAPEGAIAGGGDAAQAANDEAANNEIANGEPAKEGSALPEPPSILHLAEGRPSGESPS